MKIAPNWSGIAAIVVVGALAGIALATGHVELATALSGVLKPYYPHVMHG